MLGEDIGELPSVGAGGGEVVRGVALGRHAHRRHVAQEPHRIGRAGDHLLSQRVARERELRDRIGHAAGRSRTCRDGDEGGVVRQIEGVRCHDPRHQRIEGIGGAGRMQ